MSSRVELDIFKRCFLIIYIVCFMINTTIEIFFSAYINLIFRTIMFLPIFLNFFINHLSRSPIPSEIIKKLQKCKDRLQF